MLLPGRRWRPRGGETPLGRAPQTSISPTTAARSRAGGVSSPASREVAGRLWWGAGGAAVLPPGASLPLQLEGTDQFTPKPPGSNSEERAGQIRQRPSAGHRRWSARTDRDRLGGRQRPPGAGAGPQRCGPSSSAPRHPRQEAIEASGRGGQEPLSGPPMTRSPSRSTGGSEIRSAEPTPAGRRTFTDR